MRTKPIRQLLAIPADWIRPSNDKIDSKKVESIKKSISNWTFPHDLLIFPGKFFFVKNGFYFLITDGNHRLRAMYELLNERKSTFIEGNKVLVYLLTDEEYNEIKGTKKSIDTVVTSIPVFLYSEPKKV